MKFLFMLEQCKSVKYNYRYWITFLLLLFCNWAYPHIKSEKVEGQYTYYCSENVSLATAKTKALHGAMIDALGGRYGYVITQYSHTFIDNNNGESEIDFSSIGLDEVRGEWIETIGEPEFSVTYEQHMIIVCCKVVGKAREIVTKKVNFEVHLLRNGTEDRFADDRFMSGDKIHLSFVSPVDGYLTVYLVDEKGKALRCLPYLNSPDGVQRVEHDKRYVFWQETDDASTHDFIVTTNQDVEHNMVYVIFSPNPFLRVADAYDSETLLGDYIVPSSLDKKTFLKWLAKVRSHDLDMVMYPFNITIRN